MSWIPHITVAAIIEKNARFLMVTEKADNGLAINQPAGHWENGESLVDAAVRETLEETAHDFKPHGLVGCYQWTAAKKNRTYLRICFHGEVTGSYPEKSLDEGIISTSWFSKNELENTSIPMRSPLVIACIDDYLDGKRYPLEFLRHLTDKP